MVNRKTGTFSMEVTKSVDKGVRNTKCVKLKIYIKEMQQTLFAPKGEEEKYKAEGICSGKGLLNLAQWCTGLTWGFSFWFGLLCMRWCVSLCVSSLSPASTCFWMQGDEAAQWFCSTTCLSETKWHSGVWGCKCMHCGYFAFFYCLKSIMH